MENALPSHKDLSFEVGQTVEIHSILTKPKMNGLIGKITQRRTAGRFGVQLVSTGELFSLKQESLCAVRPLSLEEKNTLCLLAVARFFETSAIGDKLWNHRPLIWAFLRDTCHLAVVEETGQIIEEPVMSLKLISLQTGRVDRNVRGAFTEEESTTSDCVGAVNDNMIQFLQGPCVAHCANETYPRGNNRKLRSWALQEGLYLPFVDVEAEGDDDWMKRDSGRVEIFRAGDCTSWAAIVSADGGWIAKCHVKLPRKIHCIFHDVTNGHILGHVDSDLPGLELYAQAYGPESESLPADLWVVAHGDYFLASTKTHVLFTRITRGFSSVTSITTQLVEVSRSDAFFDSKFARSFSPVALHSQDCAVLTETRAHGTGASKLCLFQIDGDQLVAEPRATLSPTKVDPYASFGQVALTHDKLIVTELVRADVFSFKSREIVVRSSGEPYGPPMLVLPIHDIFEGVGGSKMFCTFCREGILAGIQTFFDANDIKEMPDEEMDELEEYLEGERKALAEKRGRSSRE